MVLKFDRSNRQSNRQADSARLLRAYGDLPEFLTPSEVQAYLNLSRTTVYDLLRRNEIQHVRFGRAIRIPKAALKQGDGLAAAR